MAGEVALGSTSMGLSGYSPVGNSTVASTEVPTIMKGLTDLVNLGVKVQAKRQIEQDEEDLVNAKFLAQQDITEIDTARETGNSSNKKLNDIYAKGQSEGWTKTEINNAMYDAVLGDRTANLNHEAGKADRRYFEAMIGSKTQTWNALAKGDRELIAKQQLDKATSTSFMDADVQSEYNNSLAVMKRYGILEGNLEQAYITKAYSLAKQGDTSALDKLKTIKNSQGVSILSTTDGMKANDILNKELLSFRDQESARIERDKNIKYADNADSIFSIALNGDPSKAMTMVQSYISSGKLDYTRANSLVSSIKTISKGEGGYALKSDPKYFNEIYTKASFGSLNLDEVNTSRIAQEDLLSIAKVNVNAIKDTNTKVLNDIVQSYATSASGFDPAIATITSVKYPEMAQAFRKDAEAIIQSKLADEQRITGMPLTPDKAKEIADKKANELKQVYTQKISERNQEDKAIKDANAKLPKQATNPSKPQEQPAIIYNTIAIDSVKAQFQQNKDKEGFKAWFLQLPPSVQSSYLDYDNRRLANGNK